MRLDGMIPTRNRRKTEMPGKYLLHRATLIGISIAVSAVLVLPAGAQNIPKRKPGLWETQMMGTGPDAEHVKQRLAQMTPQQRAQMEEKMNHTGTGFNAEGAMVMRYCLTPEDADIYSGRKLLGKMEKDADRSNCDEKELKRGASDVHFQTMCQSPEGVTEFIGHVYDITPTSMAMEMTVKRPEHGEQHMTQKARWISG